MDAHLNEAEVECARRLAAIHEKGAGHFVSLDMDALGLTRENYAAVLGTMEHLGLITDAVHTTGGQYFHFRVTGRAVQLVRDIDQREQKAEAPDIVEQTKKAIRSHPVMGYVVVAVIGLSFLLVLVNQAISLLERLGVIPK